VAVIAAFELDDLLAAGGATRQADGAHAGLGARADQTHHVDAGDELDDFLSQLHFAFCGGAKAEAVQCRFLHGFQHGRVTMSQDHRAPGTDVVDIALVIGIPEVGALGALHKTGGAADGFEGANRRVHAAGNALLRPFKQGVVAISHVQSVRVGIGREIVEPVRRWVGRDGLVVVAVVLVMGPE